MQEKYLQYFHFLREKILSAFEKIEGNTPFTRIPWEKPSLGKGEMAILRGKVFEKAAVNFSKVSGEKFPAKDASGPYFASGVSLITHMMNPKMPTVHMNIRYIETENKRWIGGGYDLTPMGFDREEDTLHFHTSAKKGLDQIDPNLYPTFSAAAKEYFFVKHRNKERGVGGIFFDHWQGKNENENLKLLEVVGSTFLEAILPIYEKNKALPYTEEDKILQNRQRAHYVEFNLLYDRGTKFGFESGGNPEAILASMPPIAYW